MNLCVAIILIVGIWHVNVYVGRIKMHFIGFTIVLKSRENTITNNW